MFVEDGLATGFDNAGDIAANFLAGLSSQLLQLAATRALKNAFPTLFAGAFATGGSFVADRPALFLAGESGPERVTVENH